VRLIFRQNLPLPPADDADQPITGRVSSNVIARVMLPALAAERLLRLLPVHLAKQRELAADYDRDSERRAADPRVAEVITNDPILDALAAADVDDEPLTDEECAAARGWEAYERGESAPWEDVRRALLDEAGASKLSTS
jgi:hypothetical protein